MLRKIIKIDEEKCNGCGLCASACHEGAIDIIDGKARLVREHFCDGLGDCLPSCPVDAISFEEREAPAYDEQAVKKNQKYQGRQEKLPCGCPGTQVKTIRPLASRKNAETSSDTDKPFRAHGRDYRESQLSQWPVQIKLVPVKAGFFDGAKLLVAADCTAYAYGDFHERFIKGRITLVGCPKLDEGDYTEKLTEIITNNDIKELTIVRMEVPCCGGLERAATEALRNSGKFIPWQVVTISTDGKII